MNIREGNFKFLNIDWKLYQKMMDFFPDKTEEVINAFFKEDKQKLEELKKIYHEKNV